ncbi:MAG TPA: amidohydrolase family protein, partial [Clostridia bacterium]|nr:amidohydrolase family protein [Clostridia bacterium]
DDIFTAIRIAKQFDLDYVIVHCTEGHLISEELCNENVRALSGPFLCDRSKPELSQMTPKSPGIMSKAGIPVALITDHSVVPIQYLMLCAAIAVKEGMDRREALRAVTINPARILGLENRIGSLKAGKDADLAIYSGDPFSVFTQVKCVIINGKRVR